LTNCNYLLAADRYYRLPLGRCVRRDRLPWYCESLPAVSFRSPRRNRRGCCFGTTHEICPVVCSAKRLAQKRSAPSRWLQLSVRKPGYLPFALAAYSSHSVAIDSIPVRKFSTLIHSSGACAFSPGSPN